MARIIFCRKRNLPVLRNLEKICLQYHVTQQFQIPIRPGNSGEKSHSVESTEIPIYLFYFYLLKKKKERKPNGLHLDTYPHCTPQRKYL